MTRPIAAAALAALTGAVLAAALRLHRMRRALTQERAARRLTDAAHHRDLTAFAARLDQALHQPERQILTEADQVLDTALAHHRPEGGHRP